MPNMAGVARTDPGLKRKRNEDSFFLDNSLGLYLVADGMGGAASGELASKLVAETVGNYVGHYSKQPLDSPERYDYNEPDLSEKANTLLQGVHLANSLVYEASHREDENQGMGSTVAAVMADGDWTLIVNVGDSRVMRSSRGELYRLTVDHRVLEDPMFRDVVDPGTTIITRMGNVLTRAMGVRQELEPDFYQIPLEEGDIFLICSDGLTDMVSEDVIAKVLAMDRSLAKKADDLIELALAGGGKDNVTVILIETVQPGRLKGLLNRIKGG